MRDGDGVGTGGTAHEFWYWKMKTNGGRISRSLLIRAYTYLTPYHPEKSKNQVNQTPLFALPVMSEGMISPVIENVHPVEQFTLNHCVSHVVYPVPSTKTTPVLCILILPV